MDWWSVAQHPKKKTEPKKVKANATKPKKSKVGEEIDISNKEELKDRWIEIWDRLKEKFWQFDLNGIHNIWIVKPAGLSRGRGIQVFASLVEILDNCHKEGQWVAQKYIENPMIIQGRKFDIRQWVLVTSWNPLTIWFWNKPYIRFPAAEYDPNNLNDRFVHLTNNSVAKYAKNCTEIGQGNMWSSEEFAEYLEQEYGEDVWENSLRKNMQQVVKNSLEAVQDMFDENNTKGTWTELYGFDLMVDDKWNPWLIEVNASPWMEASTPVTEKLWADVLEDTIKVIVDYHYAKKKSKVDTGDWQLICKKKPVEWNQVNSWGLNFVWEGTKMKVKKQKGGAPSSSIPIKEIKFQGNNKVDEEPMEQYDEVKPESDDDEKYDPIGQELNIEKNIHDEIDEDNDVDEDGGDEDGIDEDDVNENDQIDGEEDDV